ncbi:hypothetical protein EVJ58_g128 [Rhodofomes roseus]|uniref:Uncharacterized protein n=1 Tax=Rhodofomes roseus TaxID=34475 RepID=A0A4Y9Z7W5_9APHY|nr:hypothetical protein EVJ58_g128 [Rhodofomes roseus]
MFANRPGSLSKRPTLRPSPLTRFSTSVVSLLKAQPAEASASVTSATTTPTLPVTSLTSSPTSSVLSLPLSSDPEDDAASKITEELRRKLEASEAALAAKSRTVAGLEESVKSLVTESAEGEKSRALQEEVQRGTEERLADVEQRLTEAIAETTRKDLELETARSEIDETRAGLQETRSELESMKTVLQRKDEEHRAMLEESDTTKSALAGVEATLVEERHIRSALQSELQASKRQLEETAEARARVERDNAELNTQVAELQTNAANQMKELKAIGSKLDDAERALRSNSDEVKMEHENRQAIESELQHYKEDNTRFDAANAKLSSELESRTTELRGQSRRLAEQNQELESLRCQADAHTANAETLARLLAETGRARDDALSELSALKFQLSDLQMATHRAADTAMHEVTEVRWQAMKTESALSQRVRDLEEALRSAQDDAAQEIKKVRGEMRRLREELRNTDVNAGGSCTIQ